MRILHVLPAYYPAVRYGGPVVAVHGLARAMVARGHHVEVMTTNVDGKGVSDVSLHEPYTCEGVTVRYFGTTMMRRVFHSPQMRRVLDDVVSSFDAVHIHQMYQWPGVAAARAAQRHGVPYVVSPRGMLVKEMIDRRSTVAKTAWIRMFDRRSLEAASAIHATSELEQAELERFRFNLPAVTAIPNGVDDPAPVPVAADMAEDVLTATAEGPIVLYLGRLSWKKGLERLVQAFGITMHGDLVIAGTDDEGLGAGLNTMARKLGIAQRVHVLPRTIGGAEKEFLFAAARVFVLPSFSENFGNSLLEAMQRGVPVITTPQVGAAEIVRRSGGGIITGGEPEALGHAMTRFINHPSLARSMGAAGRNHAKVHYRWPQIAARMEELYAGLRK